MRGRRLIGRKRVLDAHAMYDVVVTMDIVTLIRGCGFEAPAAFLATPARLGRWGLVLASGGSWIG
jgi:hypothetical protein